MHEHSKGHARQSFRVTGAWRFRNGGEEEEEEVGGAQGGKISSSAGCGGGGDHAEEKCQTVLDQADQRHSGTKITESPPGLDALSDPSPKMLWELQPCSFCILFYFFKSRDDRQLQ